ncbi:MAG: 30S ribosomal protein S8 [Patescibacteria group bacterium]|nr:30S ribosomal protein S8 [Patescibacteria group bacterium]
MNTDPISDMLTRIRNAAERRFPAVDIPYSRLKERIADLMVKNGWLDKFEVMEGEPSQTIVLTFKYFRGHPAIKGLKRISKPGLRVHMNSTKLNKSFPNKLEMIVISTSKGLLTRREAQKEGLGGEIMFKVW